MYKVKISDKTELANLLKTQDELTKKIDDDIKKYSQE